MPGDGPAPPPNAAEPRTRGDAGGGEAPGGGTRDELVAAAPFLTWRAIYAIVLGALAIEVALFAALTAALNAAQR